MKTMKVALLATAALAAVSVSARADDTAAIKAQLEALTARIAQLEAAPAAPVGFSLLTISEAPATVAPGLEQLDKAYGKNATVIGIMPTADVPASTTVEWSGYVKAAIMYSNEDYGDDSEDGLDVLARGQLKVVGKTDTAVGEVGVQIQMRGDFEAVDTKATVKMNEAWGWWAMTPELTVGGGYTGSLGNIGYGYDGACNCYYTDNWDSAFNPGDATQLRLSWASGPISAAVAIEDATEGSGNDNFAHDDYDPTDDSDDALRFAGEIKYSGDTMNGEVSVLWSNSDNDYYDYVDSYQLGGGLGFSLGDMATLSLAAALGRTTYDYDFWGASALLSANLSDSVHAEIAAAYKSYDENNTDFDYSVLSALIGIYYEPVAQLTIGLEAEYVNYDANYDVPDDTHTSIDFVTVYRF